MSHFRDPLGPGEEPDPDPRRLAAAVPRYGEQVHPEPDGDSTDDPFILDEPADSQLPERTRRTPR